MLTNFKKARKTLDSNLNSNSLVLVSESKGVFRLNTLGIAHFGFF
jgi:hypothetical protein